MFVVLYIPASHGKDNKILKRGYIVYVMVTTNSSQNLSGLVNFNFRTNINFRTNVN